LKSVKVVLVKLALGRKQFKFSDVVYDTQGMGYVRLDQRMNYFRFSTPVPDNLFTLTINQ